MWLWEALVLQLALSSYKGLSRECETGLSFFPLHSLMTNTPLKVPLSWSKLKACTVGCLFEPSSFEVHLQVTFNPYHSYFEISQRLGFKSPSMQLNLLLLSYFADWVVLTFARSELPSCTHTAQVPDTANIQFLHTPSLPFLCPCCFSVLHTANMIFFPIGI